MIEEQEAVAAFHDKFGFDNKKKLFMESDYEADTGLLKMADSLRGIARHPLLAEIAKISREVHNDDRTWRAQLMIEEVAELVRALANKDTTTLADGIADSIYVILGTAETYEIPAKECFDEAHRSNMSKTRDSSDPRMRAKDVSRGYIAPDFVEAVIRGRKRWSSK